jgi:predicted CXXCH cytochrome family protein
VANGWCVACHNPHRSARQYMLLGKDSVELCTACHTKADLLLTTAHQKDPKADCLSCHNPHMGKTAFLLRSTYVEWQIYESTD